MCSECRKQFCADLCPNQSEPSLPVCEDCGEVLDECFAYLDHNGNHYCIDCVEGMSTDEILRICGISNILEMLTLLEEKNQEKEGKSRVGLRYLSANGQADGN